MAEFNIHVNETGEEEDNLLVIVLDAKYKTEASFAMPRDLKVHGQIKLIKSALAKVKFLNDNDKETRIKKSVNVLKKKAEKLNEGFKKSLKNPKVI